MKKISLLLSLSGMLALAMQIQATPIFFDNFNSENGGVGFLNYGTPLQNGDGGAGLINTSFANWVVTSGKVDLIPLASPSPTFGSTFDLTPGQGHGLYVDMDGTAGDGVLTLKNAISLGIGTYTLSYDMAGNQREGEMDTVVAAIQNGVPITIATKSLTLAENSPWTTYTIQFSLLAPTMISFDFQDTGTVDNIGNLLDNVELDSVGTTTFAAGAPDGGTTVVLLGMGLAGLAVLRRKFNLL